MKVGLLICDHVLPEFRPIGGDYPDMFSSWFPGVEWALYDVASGHFPEDPRDCEAWLCTGSRYSVYDEADWIGRLKTLVRDIRDAGVPYVGVCFGHQMLGEALGGRVQKGACGWCVGVHAFDMLRREEWMEPFRESIHLLMMCQDQVLELPPDSTVLAASEDCPVAMFRVGDTMLGVQAHPEFTLEYDRALMEARVARIGVEKVEHGIASLERTPDGELFATWVRRFIKTTVS